jgi:hypothetical protein
MEARDSLLLDGEGPHGPLELLDLPIRFLAIAGYFSLRRAILHAE